jgi:hypothetical protein
VNTVVQEKMAWLAIKDVFVNIMIGDKEAWVANREV